MNEAREDRLYGVIHGHIMQQRVEVLKNGHGRSASDIDDLLYDLVEPIWMAVTDELKTNLAPTEEVA